MFGILHSKRGFTLVELIVVVIIVGILASVAIPMMSGNIANAKRTEAVAAAGSIRTAVRCLTAEGITIPVIAAGAFGTSVMNSYINSTDLDGRYYNTGNYAYSGGTTGNVTVTSAGDTGGPACVIDQYGNIT